jgi:hypothetical protein
MKGLKRQALLPRTPEAVLDWHKHFWKIRRWFLAANGIQVLVSWSHIFVSSNRHGTAALPGDEK